jgi:hypothetical protein
MPRSRTLWLPVLACSTLLLTGGLNPQTTSPASSPLPAGIDPIDRSGTPGGMEVLDAAARAFVPERVPWMQMNLWQRVACEDFTYEADGRYVCAPGHRLRLDLKVLVGQTQGELQMVSSGTALRCSWRADRKTSPAITLLEFARKCEEAGQALPLQEAERILLEHGCPAVAPLLRTVRERLQEPRWKRSRWKEHEVIQVTGRWCSGTTPAAGTGTLSSAMALRECRLYVDARTLWPHRIEWWGSASPDKSHVPLVEVEYRDPVLNQPLSAERCAFEFAF